MSDKENQNNIDVSSLINLCMRTDNLPAIQELGLKQRVSFRFERMLHPYMYNESKASMKFATYITLLETKPEVYGNVCDILLDTFVTEEVIEECLMYIRSGIIPYHLWTDKLIEDLKGSSFYNKPSIGGMLTVYLGKTLRASLIAYHKVIKALEEEEQILNDDMKKGIAFIKARFLEIPQEIREEYMRAFATNNEQERRKFQENETTIFTETLVDMLQHPFDKKVLEDMANGETNPYQKFWVDPMNAGGGTLVSNARGTGNTAMMNAPQAGAQSQSGGMGSWLELLGYGPNGETPEEMAHQEELNRRQEILNRNDLATVEQVKEEVQEIRNNREVSNVNVQYVVKKVAKDSSKRVMSTRWFNTKKEAEDFVEDITKSNPAMSKAFDFKIESGIKP